ncbi:MAG: hypothetical protein WCS69_12990 [Ignavibacteriaceae bacterium]|jgi:hypothetical protein
MKFLFILFSFVSGNVFSQNLNFFREDINFILDREYFNVEGYYWFANNSDKTVDYKIYFPVGDKNDTVLFDSINVFAMPQNVPQIILSKTSLGFSFEVNINAGDTAICRIKYRQKMLDNTAKYILLSTKTWNKPLEHAVYKLIVKQDFVIKKFSYPPDKVYRINDEKIFYWERKNFTPQYDMLFSLN